MSKMLIQTAGRSAVTYRASPRHTGRMDWRVEGTASHNQSISDFRYVRQLIAR